MNELISQVSAVLAATPERWSDLCERQPVELLRRPAAPGEWSAAECLGHLLDAEAYVFPQRVRTFLEGKQEMPAFDPDSEGSDYASRTPAQLAAEFARHRRESLALLAQVGDGDLHRTAVHSELGRVTLGQLLNEWAAHDLMHTVQAERAVMQAFIPHSGPWRHYFSDHDQNQDIQQ